MAIRKTRYQTYRDEVTGRDASGNDIIISVPDKVVTEPPVGQRFTVLEAPEPKVPTKEPYDGPPANLQVTINDSAVNEDN